MYDVIESTRNTHITFDHTAATNGSFLPLKNLRIVTIGVPPTNFQRGKTLGIFLVNVRPFLNLYQTKLLQHGNDFLQNR
jgi:hypothetical protein